jgi:Leucine-rich repeat (LRR) protein/GTPase SAR1 family protein
MAITPSSRSVDDVLHSPGDNIIFSTNARLLIDVLPQGISVVEMGGNWETGTFYVTNYKLGFIFEDSEVKETLGTVVIPLGCITSKEEPQKGKSSGGEFEFLSFHCKDMRIEHFSFWASDKNKPKTTILRLLERRILAKTPDKTFGYTTKHDSDIKPFDLERELHRQNVDRLKWRILTNEATAEKERDKVTYFSNYYPYHFVVPIDETVNFYGMAQFRVMSRFPIFIYKHPRCSGTLSRTAHVKPVVLPEVVSSYVVVLPCEDDRAHCENFLKRSEGCNNLVFLEMGDQLSRDQMWSVEEEYTGCSFQFLKTQDLNAVQNSIKDIFSRTTGKSKRDEEWKDQVAATGWLEHVSVILKGSVQVVQMMENNTAVVCQSASGMDLSTVVAALAQVQIDPYYRTIEGFGILVEKDFIECGFVFGELATTKKVDCRVLPNNLSPCWVLFVDCLWQLWWHFPTAFEWNEDFLLLLVDAALSFRFGTFLYYYDKDRQKFEGKRQSSVWSFIGTNNSLFVSPFYQASSFSGTLNCTDLFTNKSRARLWNRYFLRFICRKAIINAIDNMKGAEKEDLPIIDLSSLGLSSIPPAIATLTLRKLHTLDLSNNHLTQFPLEILQLDNLHHLSLENNQIPYVTDFILSQLKSTQLMLLNLESNDLVEFPSGLSRFSHLRTLRLSNNQITSVPSLAGLSNLEVLTLSNNKLSSLDDSCITTLQKLHTLRLSFNNLTSLPSQITNLTSLICLTLGYNQLASLPSFAPFVNLVELDLAKNGTESLPEGLPKLASLSRLYIGYNNLQKTLPTGFSQLQNLVHLDMEGNKFAEIPSDVFALQNLKRLNLDENVLQFLDMGITRLRNLTELKLKSNILSSLNPAVGVLQSLTHLDIRNDTLLHIPGVIATMPKLLGGKLLFDSTKLAHEYPSERSELLSYLQSLQVSKKPCYRMKLMVVGQENVGKSTLIRCLNSKSNVKKNVNISTDGIDIDLLSLQVDLTLPGDSFPTKENVTLTTWDFAGQEVYYTTHQFFLSEHSIYLLCWNMTEPEEKSRIEYWLRSISTTAKSAPIIIVGTHGDDPRCTREYVNEASDDIRRKYFDAYPSLQDVIPVSCSNMKGLDTLKIFLEAIVKRELESYNLEVPTPWLELEKYVIEEKKRRSTPIMSKSDFLTLAHCVNIRTDKDTQSAARFLSDLGVIVYFPNDKSLRDIIVLNPEWLTNVMSSIITTKHTFCKDGVLSHSSLRQIWRPPQFSDDLHVTLIRLLEKFEITHVLANESSDFYAGSSLIPSLLPEERPTAAILKYWPEATGENEPIFCRIYSFEFVPKGLMSRTMVRLFHFSTPLVFWRNGMILSMKDPSASTSGVIIPLKDDKDSERVFVELNPTTRVITMFFRGRGYNGESQAKLFIEAFLDLLTGFFNVKWKASVPCVHCLRKQAHMNSLQTTQFAEADLERAAIVPGAKVTCGDVQVSVSELVPDIAMTQAEGSRILCEEIDVGEQVGEGGYALVYKGTYRGQLVAVKKIKIERHTEGEDDSALLVALSEFRREVWIMR